MSLCCALSGVMVYRRMVREGHDRDTAASWGAGQALLAPCLYPFIIGFDRLTMPPLETLATMVAALVAAPLVALWLAGKPGRVAARADLATLPSGPAATVLKVMLVAMAVVWHVTILALAHTREHRLPGHGIGGVVDSFMMLIVGPIGWWAFPISLWCVLSGMMVFFLMVRDGRDRLTAAAAGAGPALAAPCLCWFTFSLSYYMLPRSVLLAVMVAVLVGTPLIALCLAGRARGAGMAAQLMRAMLVIVPLAVHGLALTCSVVLLAWALLPHSTAGLDPSAAVLMLVVVLAGPFSLCCLAGGLIVYRRMIRDRGDRLTAAAWGVTTSLVAPCFVPGAIFLMRLGWPGLAAPLIALRLARQDTGKGG